MEDIKIVVFEVKRSDSTLLKYIITRLKNTKFKTVDEVDAYLYSENCKEGKTVSLYRVTNSHFIEALLKKEQFDTVAGKVVSVLQEFKDIEREIKSELGLMRDEISSLADFVNERYSDEVSSEVNE